MQLDPSTAAVLREVHERKLAAVEEEDYELAKQYKQVESTLKQVGGHLAKLMKDKVRSSFPRTSLLSPVCRMHA